MRGALLAYVVWHHIKVAHIPPRSGAYLNLDEMITRAPIVELLLLNLKLNQDSLNQVYSDHQTDTFKVDNMMVYQMFSKMFTDMDTFVYVKQRRYMQESWVAFFDIHKCFFGLDHVARQAADVEGKLQNTHYDGERKSWYWDKYVALQKE